jgi:hypothetical protein
MFYLFSSTRQLKAFSGSEANMHKVIKSEPEPENLFLIEDTNIPDARLKLTKILAKRNASLSLVNTEVHYS